MATVQQFHTQLDTFMERLHKVDPRWYDFFDTIVPLEKCATFSKALLELLNEEFQV